MSDRTKFCWDYPGYPQHCCISCHEDAEEWGFALMGDYRETYEVCCGVFNEHIEPQGADDVDES